MAVEVPGEVRRIAKDIKTMRIRGAGRIARAAARALMIAAQEYSGGGLGEFLAFVEALKHAYKQSGSKNKKILVVADALSRAVSRYLEDDRTPGRKVGQTGTRGSHYWLARYWAEELARQEEDPELAQIFKPVAQALAENEERILSEIRATEGSPKDLGGYYHPDEAKLKELMRPSKTMNQIIDNL